MTDTGRSPIAPGACEPAPDTDETADDESLFLDRSPDTDEPPAIATTDGPPADTPRCNTGSTDVPGGTGTRTLSTDSVVSADADCS